MYISASTPADMHNTSAGRQNPRHQGVLALLLAKPLRLSHSDEMCQQGASTPVAQHAAPAPLLAGCWSTIYTAGSTILPDTYRLAQLLGRQQLDAVI
jgi:hypothetical protein